MLAMTSQGTVSVVSPASTVMAPEVVIVASPRISAAVDAFEVTSADAMLMPPLSESDIAAMYAFTVAWFSPRARTVSAPVFRAVDGMSPSNDASVAPSIFDRDLMRPSARTPTLALAALDFAWFFDDARTWIVPPGAENDEGSRTIAFVVAPVPIRASAMVTAIGITPNATASDSTSARLRLVACSVMPDESVMSPERSMFVPPWMRAVGTDTPTASRPPDARSVWAFAWL